MNKLHHHPRLMIKNVWKIDYLRLFSHSWLSLLYNLQTHTHTTHRKNTFIRRRVKRMKKIKIIPCILFMIFRLKMEEKPLFNRIAVNNLLSLQFDTNLIETHTHKHTHNITCEIYSFCVLIQFKHIWNMSRFHYWIWRKISVFFCVSRYQIKGAKYDYPIIMKLF